VPEQEFLPPHRWARPDGPGHQDEDPPWADMPPIRPARPSRPAAGAGGPGPVPGHRVSAEYPMGSWQAGDPPGHHQDDQVPPWAGPRAGEEEPPSAPPRVPGGRVERAAARRQRRWYVLLGGLAGLAAGVLVVVLVSTGRSGPASVVPNSLITTFQTGEFQQVPNACQSVPASTVQRYLPGQVKEASPLPVDGPAESACNWSIDKAPVYRLLELNLLAYAPNGLASGNGSATAAAIDAYETALQTTEKPPKGAPGPRGAVTLLTGLGDEAYSSLRVFREGGAVTDVAVVMVRYHNVIVTVTVNGLQHSNRGGYGPVSASQLSAAALAFAQAAEATLH
jgi:hypothetical protein